jgi:hypothetical protein
MNKEYGITESGQKKKNPNDDMEYQMDNGQLTTRPTNSGMRNEGRQLNIARPGLGRVLRRPISRRINHGR